MEFEPAAEDKTWAKSSPNLQHVDFTTYDQYLYEKISAGADVVMFFYGPRCMRSLSLKPSVLVASLMSDPKKLSFASIDCTMSGNFCAEKGVEDYPAVRHFYDNSKTYRDIVVDFRSPEFNLVLVQFVADKMNKPFTEKWRKEVMEVTKLLLQSAEIKAKKEAEKEIRRLEKKRKERALYLAKRTKGSNKFLFSVAGGSVVKEVKEMTSWSKFRKHTDGTLCMSSLKPPFVYLVHLLLLLNGYLLCCV